MMAVTTIQTVNDDVLEKLTLCSSRCTAHPTLEVLAVILLLYGCSHPVKKDEIIPTLSSGVAITYAVHFSSAVNSPCHGKSSFDAAIVGIDPTTVLCRSSCGAAIHSAALGAAAVKLLMLLLCV
jgi:hypothetical protein